MIVPDGWRNQAMSQACAFYSPFCKVGERYGDVSPFDTLNPLLTKQDKVEKLQ
jgi:hypothetical protein